MCWRAGHERDGAERERPRTAQSFCVPKADIAAHGYDLSLNRYKEVVHEAVEHRAPKEILVDLAKLEEEIQQGMKEAGGDAGMTVSKRVPLSDVAVIERDIVDSTAIGSGTLYVGLENIESGGRFVGVRPVDAGELASSKFAFTRHHLLYGKLRPYLAKIARPEFDGICSTDILPLRPGPDLDRGYLAWLLLTPEMVAYASSRATGANLPRLSPSALAEFKIPLPHLPEQRRIAEILDKADALRAKRRAALAQLDTLTRSVFFDMFGDPATNPKGWPFGRDWRPYEEDRERSDASGRGRVLQDFWHHTHQEHECPRRYVFERWPRIHR